MPREGSASIVGDALADVALIREASRRRRVRRLTMTLGILGTWLWLRVLTGRSLGLRKPHLGPDAMIWLPGLGFMLILGIVLLIPLVTAGRSPHVMYRSSEISIGMDDVRGAGIVKEEVIRTLDLFLAYKTFRDTMGGTPRRAILFEGPPGTGKTYMAKAMAREAGVPFLFVSSSAFQSMYYGQTNRKIRSYFKALRTAARKEGGAIGFIEEIDAIGGARSGMGGRGRPRGITRGLNQPPKPLQSFAAPSRGTQWRGWFA